MGSQANQAALDGKAEKEDAIKVNRNIAVDAFNDIRKIPKDTADPEYKSVIEFMVQTLGTVASYGQFIDEEILTSFVQTMEYVLRVQSVMV